MSQKNMDMGIAYREPRDENDKDKKERKPYKKHYDNDEREGPKETENVALDSDGFEIVGEKVKTKKPYQSKYRSREDDQDRPYRGKGKEGYTGGVFKKREGKENFEAKIDNEEKESRPKEKAIVNLDQKPTTVVYKYIKF